MQLCTLLLTFYEKSSRIENDFQIEKNNNVRVETKNHTKYYQYVPQENSNHLFLRCKSCGKSLNLKCQEEAV